MEISESLQAQLAELGVDLNTTLTNTISAASEVTVLNAVAALKEAIAAGKIERPGGWLKRAIDRGWKPNHPVTSQTTIVQFKQWYDLAHRQGLIIASMKQADGELLVFDREGCPHPWIEMLNLYPLEGLQDNVGVSV